MNVSLEPETDCGKSDIYFEYEGVPYLVECYCPSFLTGGQDTSSHLIKAAGAISDVIRESKKPLRVCLRLKKSISAEEDKRVGYFAAKVICEMGSGAILIREDDVIKIDIHDISGMSVDTDFPKLGGPFKFFEGASWGLKILSVPEHRIDEVRLGKYKPETIPSRIFVWKAESEKEEFNRDEFIGGLADKIAAKFKQTKRSGDEPRRIVVAKCSIGRDRDAESQSIAKEIQNIIVPKYPKIACIILTDRGRMDNHRYRYDANFLMGSSESALHERLLDQMGHDEYHNDILSEYK